MPVKNMNELVRFQDKDVVKVVVGVRRCGKSMLLDLMAEHLREQGVEKEGILFFKMESMEFDHVRKDYRALYDLVRERADGLARPYLFLRRAAGNARLGEGNRRAARGSGP